MRHAADLAGPTAMDELYSRVKAGVNTDRALIVMDTCFSGAGGPGATLWLLTFN